jgi:hypothetical protein
MRRLLSSTDTDRLINLLYFAVRITTTNAIGFCNPLGQIVNYGETDLKGASEILQSQCSKSCGQSRCEMNSYRQVGKVLLISLGNNLNFRRQAFA